MSPPENNDKDNNNREPLRSHLSIILTCPGDANGPQDLDQAQTFYQEGKALHESGDYPGAVEAFQKALLLQELYLGKYHKHTIKTYWRIGRSSILNNKDYKRALISFKRALRMAESTFGKAHESEITKELIQDIMEFLQNNGLNENNDYMGAIVQALELERQGDAFCKAKNYKNAVKQYKQAIYLEETIFGFNANVDCADINCKFAFVYRLQGDNASSTLAYHKALQSYRLNLGEQHPATCGAKANLEAVSKNQTASGKKQSWWGKASSSFRGNSRRPIFVQ
jgi:tetratricopeptide (TPR) repeat protein